MNCTTNERPLVPGDESFSPPDEIEGQPPDTGGVQGSGGGRPGGGGSGRPGSGGTHRPTSGGSGRPLLAMRRTKQAPAKKRAVAKSPARGKAKTAKASGARKGRR